MQHSKMSEHLSQCYTPMATAEHEQELALKLGWLGSERMAEVCPPPPTPLTDHLAGNPPPHPISRKVCSHSLGPAPIGELRYVIHGAGGPRRLARSVLCGPRTAHDPLS